MDSQTLVALLLKEQSSKCLIFHGCDITIDGGMNRQDVMVIALLFSLAASLVTIYKVRRMEKKYHIS